VVAWEHETLQPKHHLLARLALLESSTTLAAADAQVALAMLRAAQREDSPGNARLLDAFSLQYQLRPETARVAGAAGAESGPPRMSIEVRDTAWPRAWLVERFVQLPPLKGTSIAALRSRTNEIFFPDGQPRDLRATAVLETETALPPLPTITPPLSADCRIVRDEVQRIVLEAECRQAALLVLNDYYCDAWEARIHTAGASRQWVKVYRTNRVMRGVLLPAGKHLVEFVYRPRLFWIGAVLSALAWILLAGHLIGSLIHNSRRRRNTQA
jgi:hypothetical protein